MQIPTKIPTIVGIFLVVLLVGSFIVGSESYFRSSTNASGSILPANVQMTNISDTSFTVSWTTELPATGALSIASPKISNQIIFDDQDTGNTTVTTPKKEAQGKYVAHSVTFRGAAADTEYALTILSDSKKHLDNDKPFKIHTAPTLTSVSGNLEPAYGTILTSTNQPVGGALVYITLEGGQTLSTETKPSGTWLIPLNLARTQDLTSFLPITERMTESLTVRANGLETTALTDTLNDSPVPDMTLGKTYDFRRSNAKAPGASPLALRPTPQPTNAAAAVLGVSTTKPTNTVSLVIPGQNAALPTTLPLIQGTGIPGKTVSVIVGITNPMGGVASVGADGLWSYTPTKPLAPGKQSVTITTQDIHNKPIALTHSFEILKSGTQVLGDATPSATLTPTITLAPLSTGSATLSATPTIDSTLAAQPVPTSGNELPTIILLLLGIGLFVGGGVAFIL